MLRIVRVLMTQLAIVSGGISIVTLSADIHLGQQIIKTGIAVVYSRRSKEKRGWISRKQMERKSDSQRLEVLLIANL